MDQLGRDPRRRFSIYTAVVVDVVARTSAPCAASDAAKPMEGWLAMGCAVAKDSDVSDREGPVAALAAGRQTPPL